MDKEQSMTIQEIYKVAREIDLASAMRAVQCAETKQKRQFYAFIADINLQRAQKAVIEAYLF